MERTAHCSHIREEVVYCGVKSMLLITYIYFACARNEFKNFFYFKNIF